MHTTVTIDDELHPTALKLADPELDEGRPVHEAIKMFVQV
jgi:hypothetical protein